MAQVAVAIGIGRAGSLVKLPGAVNGARDFYDWAKSRGYESHLVTDERDPVKVADLSRLLDRIVRQDQPDRLLLYFAGHGIQPALNTPYWLLSDWENDGNEAVNVNLSCHHAKRSGIGQIALFADACRSTIPDAASVGGSSIFPKAAMAAGRQPQWDQFLASRLGEIAQEVPADKAAEAYGVFTRCLMTALSGAAPDAFEERAGKDPRHAVTSQKLADYLEESVPLESGKLPGAIVQFPDVVSGWRPERNFYFGVARVEPVVEAPGSSLQSIDRGDELTELEAQGAVAEARKRDATTVRASTEAFDAARGRESFETRQGLTIIGAVPKSFAVRGGGSPDDLFQENTAWHVRGRGDRPQSVLVELDGGNWLATSILPQFIGTILVKDGLAATLNYAPARSGSYPRASFDEIAQLLNRWTALMHQGQYGDAADFTNAAESLRKYRHSNPSLGILAAYAFERAGAIDQIDDIAWRFAEKGQPIPFDVAMLSTVPVERTPLGLEMIVHGQRGQVAGSFPMLAQGWSFIDPSDNYVHPALIELRSGLRPALWTTLSADAGKQLATLIHKGELS